MPRQTRGIVHWARTQVQTPTANFPIVSFVFHNNQVAVWQEDKPTRKFHRVLYSDSATLVRPTTAREPVKVVVGDEEWVVRKLPGGYG